MARVPCRLPPYLFHPAESVRCPETGHRTRVLVGTAAVMPLAAERTLLRSGMAEEADLNAQCQMVEDAGKQIVSHGHHVRDQVGEVDAVMPL